MLLDVLIICLAVGAIFRGREIGFVRQVCSTVGFFSGLFLGADLEPHTIISVHGQVARVVVTLITTLGCGLIFLTLGEYVGVLLKSKVLHNRINPFDNGFGSLVSVASLLLSVWLTASVITSLPFPSVQQQIHDSKIVSALDKALPSAPGVIADLGDLIDPNGFPQVFIGSEPIPKANVNLPSLGQMKYAVVHDENSIVKVAGEGCGGIVEGSGFVIGKDLIATNAHVVAGIKHPYVEDANGTHSTKVIWFDPNLDFAILKVSNLAGTPLAISSLHISSGTPAAVLGYPGGGPFSAGTAAVLDEFTASGKNIYGTGDTNRDVFEVSATIIPGNSGGPLVGENGDVIGIVFAESTSYQHVGYALTTPQVISEINLAKTNQNQTASTGKCAE
jgi:S1-C subfamily serine protease